MEGLQTAGLSIWELLVVVGVIWITSTFVRAHNRRKARQEEEQRRSDRNDRSHGGGDYVDYQEVD